MADKRKLVDDPFTAFRKAIIKAGKRHMETYVNMSYGAEPEAKAEWSPRRKKVWKDSQLPTKEAPTYLKAAQDFAEGFQRAEAERQAPVRLGIVMLGGVKDLESWQQEAKKIEEEPQRLAIEAEVVESVIPSRPMDKETKQLERERISPSPRPSLGEDVDEDKK